MFTNNDLKILDLRNIDYKILKYLIHNNLLKSYVYASASKFDLNSVESYLILDYNLDKRFLSSIQYPFQIRADYKKLNRCKPMGGITIRNHDITSKLIKNLIKNGYYPIITPDPKGYLNRFKNLYSFNILFWQDSIIVEAVGKGFDLSDLKRGNFNPHETIVIDKNNKQILRREVVDFESYQKSVLKRQNKIKLLISYELFVNKYGFMLEKLENYYCLFKYLENTESTVSYEPQIPFRYNPMPRFLINNIIKMLDKIDLFNKNIEIKSDNIVFSFSYNKSSGIVLWDIYGEWYRR